MKRECSGRRETLISRLDRKPVQTTLAISAILGGLPTVVLMVRHPKELLTAALMFPVLFLLALSGVLTVENLFFLFRPVRTETADRAARCVGVLTLCCGSSLSALYLAVSQVMFAQWDQQLSNAQLHTPVSTTDLPTVAALAALAVAGYLALQFVPLHRQPPLVTVLCLAALYLGAGTCILWCVQTSAHFDIFLWLFPVNCVILAAQTVRRTVVQKQAMERKTEREKGGKLSRILLRSANWPWLALLAAVPLLGVLTAVLTLFGQEPDSLIRAWTQTADWTLSQKIAPQNIYYDEHYLCTVAAGGHRQVVRPLRTGRRHGHRVVVNRQLCIANAFEELLQERTPRLHRTVRGLYDRLGYPIARHIRSPYGADVLYYLMKPLEWLFLTALYLCDTAPENRIAVQYPHAPLPAEYKKETMA